MTSAQTANFSAAQRWYGTVKWFGGHNKQTGRENQFGFIEEWGGKNVFLHKKQWQGSRLPCEGDIVTFLLKEQDGRLSAVCANSLDQAGLTTAQLYAVHCTPPLNAGADLAGTDLWPMKDAFDKAFWASLQSASVPELQQLVAGCGERGTASLFELVLESPTGADDFGKLLAAAGLSMVDDIVWPLLTSNLLLRHEATLAKHLAELSPEQARKKADLHRSEMPPALLTFLVVSGVYTTTNQLGLASVAVYNFLKDVLIRGKLNFPSYLQERYDADLAANGKPSSPVLRDIVDNLQFKKSLFDKSADFIDIYNASERLGRNIETFVLHHLFSLLRAGNGSDLVYQVFLQRLWEALLTQTLLLDKQKVKLHALFPPCSTMGPELSCEAVHWLKQQLFLCRGKMCAGPAVLPKANRHYLDFSIYDWLHHYGVNYEKEDKPQNQDFPIKLAGYFNRLREIFPRLHCRCCGELMVPNMSYARTEYKELVDGQIQTTVMAAAYRLTVFHCNNDVCNHFDIDYYINHCVGFGCYHIIDSRDLKQRCSHGRYVCRGCGSCCFEHGRSDPVGMCGDCGSSLEVCNEQVRGRQATYTRKYAKCSSPSCGFRIEGEYLPTKFSRVPAKNAQALSGADDSYDFG